MRMTSLGGKLSRRPSAAEICDGSRVSSCTATYMSRSSKATWTMVRSVGGCHAVRLVLNQVVDRPCRQPLSSSRWPSIRGGVPVMRYARSSFPTLASAAGSPSGATDWAAAGTPRKAASGRSTTKNGKKGRTRERHEGVTLAVRHYFAGIRLALTVQHWIGRIVGRTPRHSGPWPRNENLEMSRRVDIHSYCIGFAALFLHGCTPNGPLQVDTSSSGGRSTLTTAFPRTRPPSTARTPSTWRCSRPRLDRGTIGVKWSYQGRVIDEPQRQVLYRDAAATEFHLVNSNGFPSGQYSVEVFVDGKSVGDRNFNVN